MQLKSRAAVHLDNEGGSLNRIVCDTENTSLKMIAKTAKVVWQKISRVDLGDCRCWKIFFLQFGKILLIFHFNFLRIFLPYMSHSQMLGKVESGGGPIFKVVLEC